MSKHGVPQVKDDAVERVALHAVYSRRPVERERELVALDLDALLEALGRVCEGGARME